MSRQPMNLSSLLTVSARGRGTTGRVASTRNAPPPPRCNRGVLHGQLPLLGSLIPPWKLGTLIGTNVPGMKTPRTPPRRQLHRFSNPFHRAPRFSLKLRPPNSLRVISLFMSGTVRVRQKPHWPLPKACCCQWTCRRNPRPLQIG